MSTTKAFCGRPGCGLARALHPDFHCPGYLEPTRKAPSHEAHTSHIDMSQLRSDLEEALTMAEAFREQDKAIALATDQLKSGLRSKDTDPDLADVYFRAALATLGNLGAS